MEAGSGCAIRSCPPSDIRHYPVLIETMACEALVVAFQRGSVLEVVGHGLSGLIVDNESEAVEACNAQADWTDGLCAKRSKAGAVR